MVRDGGVVSRHDDTPAVHVGPPAHESCPGREGGGGGGGSERRSERPPPPPPQHPPRPLSLGGEWTRRPRPLGVPHRMCPPTHRRLRGLKDMHMARARPPLPAPDLVYEIGGGGVLWMRPTHPTSCRRVRDNHEESWRGARTETKGKGAAAHNQTRLL